VIHQKNEGQSVARNVGIKRHTGDYIMFVDSDDMIEPRLVEILYTVLKKTGAEVTASQRKRIRSSVFTKDIASKAVCYCCCSGIDYVWCNLEGIGFSPCGKLYQNSIWENHLFYPHIKYEDAYLIPRKLICVSKVIWVLNGPGYLYRIREGSTTRLSQTVTINPDLGKVAWSSLRYFELYYGRESEIFQKMLLIWFKTCIYNILISNRVNSQFMRYYRSIVIKYYFSLINNKYRKYEKFRLYIWFPFISVKLCKELLDYQPISKGSEQIKAEFLKKVKNEKRICRLFSDY